MMKKFCIYFLLVVVVCFSTFSYSDFVEVRRTAKVKATPESNGRVIVRPSIGTTMVLLNGGEQSNGYYRVEIPIGLNASASEGWIYRTLVRRFPGMPVSDGDSLDSGVSVEDNALLESTSVTWPARDDSQPEPHTVFGVPKYSGHEDGDNLLREYSGFSVYWDDVVLGPRWTSIKLTSSMIDAHGDVDRESRFSQDPVIKEKELESTTHNDYKNKPGSRKWARGHIVQFDDARGWGALAGEESFYTTNIVPQIQAHNGKKWLDLEKRCSEFARDYGLVWVYCGPIYAKEPKPFILNRRIPAPVSMYKIVVSPGEDGSVDVLAFNMPHRVIGKSVELSSFLVSVDSIEEATGIDFLHELPDSIEAIIEGTVWEMWPDLPN